MLGPVIVPIDILGVGNENGLDGINQPTVVLAVDELPTANTLGLLHVNVCVGMAADTLGAVVWDKITTGNGVWQPLIGSRTTNVHVPGTVVMVQLVPLNKLVE